jgi:hypothetical protein
MDSDQQSSQDRTAPIENLQHHQGDPGSEFTVVFKGEALQKLKELASHLEVDVEKLGDVLVKGMHVMDMAKDGQLIIEKPKETLKIDLKKL